MHATQRLFLVAANLGCALRVTGGWRGLFRQLLRASQGGWRPTYGMLIGLVALGGRGLNRRYRQWLKGAESRVERISRTDLALAVSLRRLDESAYDELMANLGALTGGTTVFVDANSPRLEQALVRLREFGIVALPANDGVDCSALDDGCIGVVILGVGSRLSPLGLDAIGRALEQGADLVYGDADELDARGRRRRPRFRPGFSPDLLFYEDYMSDCLGVSRELLLRVPAWDFNDCHGSLLRWVGSATRIVHVPTILSHSLVRKAPRTPPSNLKAVLKERYGNDSDVETTSDGWRCRFNGNDGAMITVVVPTRDRLDLLRPCIESLYRTNEATRLELLIVDNRSEQPATLEWLAHMAHSQPRCRVLRADRAFNWCALNNLGVRAGEGDVFVFLNNDTVSLAAGWLRRLAEYAQRHDVGAVGPMLLYPDGSIQSAGMVIGCGDRADQLYRGTRPDFDDHAFVSPQRPRNVAAVAGACLAVARRTLDNIGGFDETYPVAGDVEFCLRAHAHGLYNVCAADVALVHHESGTRGRHGEDADAKQLARLVVRELPQDPFYNSNLAMIAGVGRGAPAFALLHDAVADPLAASARP